MQVNRPWRLAAPPVGPVKESDFEWRQEPVPAPGKGALLRYRVEVVNGPENTPRVLNELFDGSNQGKLVVRLSTD